MVGRGSSTRVKYHDGLKRCTNPAAWEGRGDAMHQLFAASELDRELASWALRQPSTSTATAPANTTAILYTTHPPIHP
jgi:hypothetical protein